ncbi:MAG: MarR family transcriptional regulator [Phycisphaeraceae bacterium]|nr:MAG: MarR family transcriptional regulator [Phycisphaeraceae bacterium]
MALERATNPERTLIEAQDRFIAAWGQMGSAWGISRTMAEAHALLFIAGRGMNTDEVMERLQISRGNASMSLRALVEWGLVSRAHKRGDRKEYFQAETDVWTMLRTIVRERMKREVEPVLASLHEIRDMTGASMPTAPTGETAEAIEQHNKNLDELIDVVTTLDKLGHRFASPSGVGLRIAATALAKIK